MRPWLRVLYTLWGLCSLTMAHAQGERVLNTEGAAGERVSAQDAGRQVREAQRSLQGKFSTAQGKTDYAAMQRSEEWKQYRQAAARLRSVDLSELKSSEEKIAFWANIYNALVVDGIIALKVKQSVQQSPGFFHRVRYQIGPHTFSLDEIEHGILRGNRKSASGTAPPLRTDDPRLAFCVPQVDPRIHFALNCGARSCPPIRAYDAEKLDAQLDLATRSFINGPDVRVEAKKNQIQISRIFEWYAEDFGASRQDVLRFVVKYLTEETAKSFLAANLDRIRVRYLPYDWALNE